MATILIADDEKLTLMAYAKIVECLGHSVVLCRDGGKALEQYQKTSPDLLLLDYNMPIMTGLEVCEAVRKLPGGFKVPIVVISSVDDEKTIINSLNAGANDYLLKPVKEAHLVAKIKNFLQTASLHKNDFDLAMSQAMIGRFKISRLLGYGSHSVVFLATDTGDTTGKNVAIKILNENLDTSKIAGPFIEIAARMHVIDSEYILKVYDHGEFGGRLYVVLEYADGGTLAGWIKNDKLAELDVIQVGIHCVKGLKELDRNGMLHLDLKPENILIVDGRCKLGDFGMRAAKPGTVALGSELWTTASYMAPEYFMGQSVDIRTDIYSLGITLYKALTGDNLFESDKPAVSMYRQLNLIPPSIKEYNTSFSKDLADLVARMLEKDPTRRPTLDELDASLPMIAEKIRLGV